MPNRLIQLLADNRRTPGRRFEVITARAQAEAGQPVEAEVFLYDTIVSSTLEAEWWGGVDAQTFVKALRGIDADVINLRIDSPGGSVFAARAMETALREHKAKVIVHIDGLAASAASFVAMAGDEVRMAPGAMMMIHKAWTLAYGNAEDLTDTAALLEKIDATLADTYAQRSGKPAAEMADLMAAETWFTAQEAVDAGLADSVKTFDQADAAAAQAAAPVGWNVKAFVGNRPASAPAAPTTPAAPQPAPADTAAPASNEPKYATQDHRARQAQRCALLHRIG